jgi:pimeloyl-ACP methyl ester carboxylesterase
MSKPLLVLSFLFLISCFNLNSQSIDSVSINFGSNSNIGRYADINGAKLYFEVYGSGSPLLLIHGGLGSIAEFKSNITDLSKYFKVIVLDNRGYGRSNNPIDSLSYRLLTEDAKKFIEYLNLDSVNICGFSDGGIIGLYLAALYPEMVKKVIASGANYKLLDPEPSDPAKDFLSEQNVKTDSFWIQFRKEYIASNPEPDKFEKHIQQIRRMWYRDPYISKKDFIKIKAPIFLLFGDRDIIPLEHGLEMYRLLPSETTQLCILPKTSHFTFSERSLMINKLIVEFLKH